ncbi:MAG: acetyl-CoA C-acetyltransferase, partial [Acidobacteria bacterium]|nr:acetyl-CoA C-acetyltransferase [Acidobacteriota bacterium]
MGSVVCSAVRTPLGRYGGTLSPLPAVQLGGVAIAAALERAGLPADRVDEVYFGHVIQAGAGQITSRQAAFRGGIPMTVPATTINKVCLSGMAAIGMADRDIRLGEVHFVVAGGMESMSNAPYSVPSARWGARMGQVPMIDLMEHDGLFCAFDNCLMGATSDRRNAELGITRAEQDEWSAASHQRAAAAARSGAFDAEIAPVPVPQRKGDPVMFTADEGIRPDSTAEALGRLRPAFAKDGTITAGNASQISDGAAALVVADRVAAAAAGLPVIAEILAYGQATRTAGRSPWAIPWEPPGRASWSPSSTPSGREAGASAAPPSAEAGARATPSSSRSPGDHRAADPEPRPRAGPGDRGGGHGGRPLAGPRRQGRRRPGS